MKILFCRCRHCRAARGSAWAHAHIRRKRKGARRKARMLLHAGRWEEMPQAVPAGYLG